VRPAPRTRRRARSAGKRFADVTTTPFPARRGSSLRIAAAILLVPLLGLTAGCGRKGALEAPNASARERPASPSPASSRALPGSIGQSEGSSAPARSAVAEGDELPASALAPGGSDAPIETSRGAKRGYTIPKQPFILDPLL